MKKILLLLLSGLLFFHVEAQNSNTKNPVLGYSFGEAFTPHYKIISYFNALAAANPSKIKLQTYGKTYEGRDLIIAFISSPKNIAALEKIKADHRNVLLNDEAVEDISIVWLSFNVHGNEPSSSETAMKLAEALVDSKNNTIQSWLENTLVIIDPCLNPDGRDRYVHWYNSVVGKKPNADPQSREHFEPWPQGRSNHYYFDLNRDWAWQTQMETKSRMKVYNEWMPHIHADYHEQYYDNPYYFAPAAEPLHKAITPWQKELQTIIGKNNAGYFDKEGWLYFTRQEFDLFYPSYGDTYPTFTGSVGMTYEQGGHSRAGLSVVTNDKDTLSLHDRIIHHFTTAVSAIEIASKNNKEILSNYKKYFIDSRKGIGSDYKTYVFTTNILSKLNELKNLFDINEIQYGEVNLPKNIKGHNYFTDKMETVKTDSFTLGVSANQPKSVLARVLLEPHNFLSDSVTYDITAWALPYAYGLKAYGIKESIPVKLNGNPGKEYKAVKKDAYAYVINWNSFTSAKVLSSLIQQNIKIRVTEKPFTSNGKAFNAGSLIILNNKSQPLGLNAILNNVKDSFQINIEPVGSGFSDKGPDFGSADVRLLKAPRIALFSGSNVSSLAVGEVWHWLDVELQYPVSVLNAYDYNFLNLENYDVIILPNGQYSFLNNEQNASKLLQFITNGGKVIALENASAQLTTLTELKTKNIKDEKEEVDYNLLKKYADRNMNEASENIPGAIYAIQLDNTHPLAFGYDTTYYTIKQSAVGFDFLKNNWNVGFIKKTNHISGFVGSKLKPAITDLVLIGQIEKGKGSFVFFADNPVFRAFWQNGKLLLANAVFIVK